MKTRTILTALASLVVASCAGVAVTASDAVVCEALRPAMPIAYHGGHDGVGGDTPDTVARIRLANARFAKACP
jgi:hypothetical protein